MNYLASPPLCVAYALAGRMDLDIVDEPLQDGVYLRDIWPSQREVNEAIEQRDRVGHVPAQLRRGVRGRRQLELARGAGGRPLRLGRRLHLREAAALLRGHARGRAGRLRHDRGRPRARAARRQRHHGPHLAGRRDQEGLARWPVPDRARRRAARLQLLRVAPRQPRGDDARHVREHPAAQPARARHRGRLDEEGRRGRDRSTRPRWSTPRRACRSACSPGKEYGSGSSRDWAAKGPRLLGVRFVLAESYERIHRSNLVGMGVLPLQFPDGESAESLGLTGEETLRPRAARGGRPDADGHDPTSGVEFDARVRIDTPNEWQYFRGGGILHYVLRPCSRTDLGGLEHHDRDLTPARADPGRWRSRRSSRRRRPRAGRARRPRPRSPRSHRSPAGAEERDARVRAEVVEPGRVPWRPPLEAIRTTWSPSRMNSSGVRRGSPLFAPTRLEQAHLLAHAS